MSSNDIIIKPPIISHSLIFFSNIRDKNIEALELKIDALKKAQNEQQLKLKKIREEEDKLAAASLKNILDAEL